MTRLVALVCILTLPARAEPDGGVILDVESGVVRVTDGGVVELVGGCWFDTETCIDQAREKVGKKAENTSLKSSAVPPPIWLVMTMGGIFLAGAVAGALGVTLIHPSASLPH